MNSQTNTNLSKYLDSIIETHVQPAEDVRLLHDQKVDMLMKRLKDELPKQSKLFENCSVELVGSAGSGTKVCEADDYDINVIINLPFDSTEVRLNFEDSSPTYASVEVRKEIVNNLIRDMTLCHPQYNIDINYTEDPFDIFVERNDKFIISSKKVQGQLQVLLLKLNFSNCSESGGASFSGGMKPDNIKYYPHGFQDIMITEHNYGFNYVKYDLRFNVDIACCLRLPFSSINHHPYIPKATEKLQNLMHNSAPFVTLTPKSSPRFRNINNCRLEKTERLPSDVLGIGDWRLDFSWLENQFLETFGISSKCVMLLKYISLWNRNLMMHSTQKKDDKNGIWSYYLKVAVMRTILDNPSNQFWSSHNLFNAFLTCLKKLKGGLSDHSLLCDLFDERCKLIQVHDISNKVFYETKEEFRHVDSVRTTLQEDCKKLLNRNDLYKLHNFVTQILASITKKLELKQDEIVKKFLNDEVFCIKGDRIKTRFLNTLLLRSVGNEVDLSRGGLVANENERLKWDNASKWRSYVDEDYFRSDLLLAKNQMFFRSYLFEQPIPEKVCKLCGDSYNNLKHVFWECRIVVQFWREYVEISYLRNIFKDKDKLQSSLLTARQEILYHDGYMGYKNSDDSMLDLGTNLAKPYLLVCSSVGITPNYIEHYIENNSIMGTKENLDSFSRWLPGCPIPPPKGIQIL